MKTMRNGERISYSEKQLHEKSPIPLNTREAWEAVAGKLEFGNARQIFAKHVLVSNAQPPDDPTCVLCGNPREYDRGVYSSCRLVQSTIETTHDTLVQMMRS